MIKIIKLLSMDTSSSCTGWCVYENGCYVKSGEISLKKIKDGAERLKKMCLSILYIIKKESPDIIVVENTVVVRNAEAQRMLTMILGVIYGQCILNHIEYVALRPTEWRSLISKEKKGRTREELKQWSVNKVKELFGLDVSNDQSDAILIGQALINKRDD